MDTVLHADFNSAIHVGSYVSSLVDFAELPATQRLGPLIELVEVLCVFHTAEVAEVCNLAGLLKDLVFDGARSHQCEKVIVTYTSFFRCPSYRQFILEWVLQNLPVVGVRVRVMIRVRFRCTYKV